MVEEKKHKLKDLLLSENEPRYALTTTFSSKEQIYIPGLKATEIDFLEFIKDPEKTMIKIYHECMYKR